MPVRSGIGGLVWSLTGLDGRDFENCADRGNLFTPLFETSIYCSCTWVCVVVIQTAPIVITCSFLLRDKHWIFYAPLNIEQI